MGVTVQRLGSHIRGDLGRSQEVHLGRLLQHFGISLYLDFVV